MHGAVGVTSWRRVTRTEDSKVAQGSDVNSYSVVGLGTKLNVALLVTVRNRLVE